MLLCWYSTWSGWWYTYPSEKHDFVSWDDGNPNWMESHKINVPNHQAVIYPMILFYAFGIVFVCRTLVWCSCPPEKKCGHWTSSPQNVQAQHRLEFIAPWVGMDSPLCTGSWAHQVSDGDSTWWKTSPQFPPLIFEKCWKSLLVRNARDFCQWNVCP